jgi:hypothetical protein
MTGRSKRVARRVRPRRGVERLHGDREDLRSSRADRIPGKPRFLVRWRTSRAFPPLSRDNSEDGQPRLSNCRIRGACTAFLTSDVGQKRDKDGTRRDMSRGTEGKRGRLDADFDVVVSEALVAATIPSRADEVNSHRDAVVRSDLAERQGPAKTALAAPLGLEQAFFTGGK